MHFDLFLQAELMQSFSSVWEKVVATLFVQIILSDLINLVCTWFVSVWSALKKVPVKTFLDNWYRKSKSFLDTWIFLSIDNRDYIHSHLY